MRRRTHLSILVALALVALAVGVGTAGAGTKAAIIPADTVYTDGVIYTVDAAHSSAQAVAVRAGKIVYVGDNAGAAAYVGAGTATVDLAGKFMMPSFIDSHAHPDAALSDLYEVNLYSLHGSMKFYQKTVKAFATAHPDLTIIQGSGWDTSILPVIGPTRYQLDAAVKSRPAVLWDLSGHEVWCNSAALKMAGITSKTPNPAGGVIERFPGTRIPSGTLREAAADLVTSKIPDFTTAQYEAGLLHLQTDVLGPLGTTTVYEADLNALSVDTPGPNALAAFEELAQQGKLTVRYRAALHLDPSYGPIDAQIQAAVAERAKHATDLFQTTSVKLFMDGVIEGHTGLLDAPYKDRPNSVGEPTWKWSDLQAAAVNAAKAGFQLHFHAIGDAACSMALNAIAAAETATGNATPRDGITHLQMVTPTDIVRMAQLNVTAVPQPYWFVKDSFYYDIQLPFLGKWRADREYPMKSFFDNGILVASGSDYPVTLPPNPIDAIATGVMRWYRGGSEWAVKGPADVFWPAERVTVQQMIDSFTINGAKANFLENETGSIEVGKSADMVVLSQNILTCKPMQIGATKVLRTVFRGQTVFAAPTTAQVVKVKEGIHAIQVGIQTWAVENADKFPPVSEVTQAGGVGKVVDGWPTDPFTGAPMKQGTDPGDYTYTRLKNGAGYRLAGHLGPLPDFIVP
jgi:predicted amidohydrolase YtcJ